MQKKIEGKSQRDGKISVVENWINKWKITIIYRLMHPTSPYFTSPHLTSPHLILHHPTPLHLTPLHLTRSYLMWSNDELQNLRCGSLWSYWLWDYREECLTVLRWRRLTEQHQLAYRDCSISLSESWCSMRSAVASSSNPHDVSYAIALRIFSVSEWVRNKSNQIKSNQIKSNQIKSNQIKSNQIKSNRQNVSSEW